MYAEGIGVEKDIKEALSCWEKGGEFGDLDCYLEIAKCYHKGSGVEQSNQLVFTYTEKAADKGTD